MRRSFQLKIAIGSLPLLVCAAACPASADIASPVEAAPPLKERIDAIDRQLYVQLVELAKFNIHFHLEANRHNKWRALTYPLGRESGTALSFAATLIDLRQQAQGLDNLASISRNKLKKAVTCGITGNAISGGTSALELAQNTWVVLRARKHGYAPAQSMNFVKSIVSKTDELLLRREQLSDQTDNPQFGKLVDLETKLVRRIRQQLLYEFATWSSQSRELMWRENTFFAVDSAQSFTRMNAGILAMKAFKRPSFARSSVICALVSNSVATLNPIVSNLTGVAMRKHHKHKLAKEFPIDRPAKSAPEFDEDIANRTDSGWLKKVVALTSRSDKMDVELDREWKEIERSRQVAQQQLISGPLIGLTGVTSSTLATVAVYGYPRDIDTANKLGFSGRITQGSGQALALVVTPYTMMRGLLRNRELRRQGQLPEQKLAERLERLNKQ